MGRLFLLMVLVLGLVSSLSTCGDERRATEDKAASEARAAALKAQSAEVAAKRCDVERSKRLTDYESAVAVRKWERAADALRPCVESWKDADLTAKFKFADLTDLKQYARNAKNPVAQRIIALDRIQRDHADAYAELASTYARLQKQMDAAEKARKRKEGVTLGMSKEEVLGSSWGRPRDINRTTNQWGVHEQWVYDGGYLYFDDGVLTSIQN